ncbi:MAG: GAF domain-containing protein [Chloroflexota bacterium]
MNLPEERITPAQDSNRERRAVYTYRFAILLAFFASLNTIATLIYSRYNGIATWRTYAEGGLILALVVIAILQARASQKGYSERNVYILLASFLGILIVRNFFLAGLGLVFGVVAISMTTTIAVLTLPSRRAGFVITTGYIAGAAIILLDYFAPYERIPAPPQIRFSILVAALAVTVFAIFLTIQQFNKFNLHSKISTLLSLAVLVPVVAIGALNVITLQRELQNRQNETLLGSAAQAAISLDAFIQHTLNTLRVEGQVPDISAFMEATSEGREISPEVRENVLATLYTLTRKDPVLITSYALLDLAGLNVLDTNPRHIGRDESASDAFQSTLKSDLPYVSDVQYDAENEAVIVFAAPVRDRTFKIAGVIRLVYKAYKMQILISEFSNLAGGDSFAAILDANGVFLAHGFDTGLILKSATRLTPDALDRLQDAGYLPPGTVEDLTLDLEGMAAGLENIQEEPVFYANAFPKPVTPASEEATLDTVAAYAMSSRKWVVLFAQSQQAYLTPLEEQTRSTILVAVLILVVASVSALSIAQLLASPITRLTSVANRIIEGDTTARADETSQDEIGTLAVTFNKMTAQLGELIGSLEARVSERTGILEKRATQLKAAAEIGRLAANVRSTGELLDRSVTLISERFGFYHVGLFLLDERREFAVLRAANSPGGQKMLANNHRLKVGQVGIVGHVAARGVARIALDVGEDAVYFDNPYLPETRSEMALPLVVGGRLIGALDVQSTAGAAFSQEDVTTLQMLADLIAIAIENARLFEESQKTLSATQSYFGELSQEGWRNMIETREQVGYLAVSDGTITPIADEWDDALGKAASLGQIVLDESQMAAAVPIVIRGQSVGVIRLQKPKNSSRWNKNDLDTAQVLADQLGAALESARLYQDAQRRALVQQAIGDIAGRMDALPEMETIMKTAVEEIGKLIGDASVSIRLVSGADEQDGIRSGVGNR